MRKFISLDLTLSMLISLSACSQTISNTPDNSEITSSPTDTPAVVSELSEPHDNSTFEVHFIDVGQADSSLILCDGYSMLIDGGNITITTEKNETIQTNETAAIHRAEIAHPLVAIIKSCTPMRSNII